MSTSVGWPWMKGATDTSNVLKQGKGDQDEGGEEERNKSNNSDTRPKIDDLIEKHRSEIDALQDSLEDNALYEPKKHDDLWLLRFLLSHHNKVDKALAAATASLEFRAKHHLDIHDLRAFPPQNVIANLASNSQPQPPIVDGFVRFFKAATANQDNSDALRLLVPPTGRHGTLFFFAIASMDTHALCKVDDEDWMDGMTYINEFSFQWLDYLTRTSGRLTKATHLINIADISLSQFNMKTQNKYVKAAQHLQNCYPQAVQAYLVCQAPKWISKPWRLLKPLLPQRVVTKLDFINPLQHDDDLHRVLGVIPKSMLPVRLGGDYEPWPIEWTYPDFSSLQKEPVDDEENDNDNDNRELSDIIAKEDQNKMQNCFDVCNGSVQQCTLF